MSVVFPKSKTRPLTFLFLGLVLLLAILWGSRPLIHDDLFFHLATGQYVVEHLRVPTTDLFSFTRFGQPWVSHEWGFGVVAHFFWFAAGYWGLVALKAALTVAILMLLLILTIRASGASITHLPPGLVALLALGLWAIDGQLILRASLFSSLFVLLLLLLLTWFDRTGSRIAMVAIATLFLLWGNFHGEVVFGLFVLGLVTMESLAGRWLGRRGGSVPFYLKAGGDRPYLPLLLGSFLLSLLNPNGIQVLLYPLRLARFLFVGEVPMEMGHFTGAAPAAMPAFYLLVIALLWGLLPLHRAKALSLTQIVTVTAFLVLSLRSHRFIFYFTLFALPVIARLASQPGDLLAAGKRWRRVRQALVGVTVVAVATASLYAWQHHPRVAVSRHFPAGAVRFLEQRKIAGRLFNHQNYGGYLHWTLSTPIFWDGRNLLFASLMEEVRQTPLDDVAKEWALDYLVLTEFEYARLVDQLDPARWGLVYWDDFAAIYLRRGGRFEAIVESHGLRHFPPFGGVEGLDTRAQDADLVAALRHELDQVLATEPACQRALYLLGLLSFYQGDDPKAERLLRQALAIGPNEFVSGALERILDRQPAQ